MSTDHKYYDHGLGRRGFFGFSAAALGMGALVGCAPASSTTSSAPASTGAFGGDLEPLPGIESSDITVGFVPITCASPIINAKAMGVFERHGLNVTLKKYTGWAELWSAYIAGELDASHMLAPMPLAIHHNYAAGSRPTRLSFITNVNGQAITVARKHLGTVQGPEDFKGMIIGLPFDYSSHNLLLRDYLTTGGLDPDHDVELRVMRPADMVASLLIGDIDAFLGPDPFNQRAVAVKAGFLHTLTRDLWDGHPCCSFAVSDDFAVEKPQTYGALMRAVGDAAIWTNDAHHRVASAEAMASKAFLNQKPDVLRAVLTGTFPDGTGRTHTVSDRIAFEPYPQETYGVWILTQLQRWGLAPHEGLSSPAEYSRTVRSVFDTASATRVLADLGQQVRPRTTETIMGRLFDPKNPTPWTQKQVRA